MLHLTPDREFGLRLDKGVLFKSSAHSNWVSFFENNSNSAYVLWQDDKGLLFPLATGLIGMIWKRENETDRHASRVASVKTWLEWRMEICGCRQQSDCTW